MNTHGKKMIAPIVITVLLLVYYAVYFGILFTLIEGVWKFLLGIIPFGVSILSLKVCIERIKEIRTGEEDDIGKY